MLLFFHLRFSPKSVKFIEYRTPAIKPILNSYEAPTPAPKLKGLIEGLDKLFEKGIIKKDALGNEVKQYIEIDPEIEAEPDFLFLLCNYHHYSTNLEVECKTLPDECKFINAPA